MTTNNNREILEQLQEAKKKNPGLAEVVDLQRDLIEAQRLVEVDISVPQYTTEQVRARFGEGVPLLRPQEMALDWGAFVSLYQQVCRIAAQHRSDLAAQFEKLLALVNEDPDSLRVLTTTYLEHGRLDAQEQEEQGELLAFVLNHALRPFLRACADALAPVVEQQLWRRGRCPICGGEPDLAFLDVESGARHLICSRCDNQWLFPRTKCPFCHTSEPTSLSYYPSEDEKYRLYVCQDCQRYLKTIDLRKMRRRVLFPIERITTVVLDVAARGEGYR